VSAIKKTGGSKSAGARGRRNDSLPLIAVILPQKHPFLFIDKIVDFNSKDSRITCLKRFTTNDYFFQGHFPGKPILPGVIIVEAMAQAGILLYAMLKPRAAAAHPDYFLGKADARFLKSAKPDCDLIIEVSATKIIDSGGMCSARARVGKNIVAEATLLFGVRKSHG
jgi:3-hydroxyacyl-[acyl-carrier-protein] dehydratase